MKVLFSFNFCFWKIQLRYYAKGHSKVSFESKPPYFFLRDSTSCQDWWQREKKKTVIFLKNVKSLILIFRGYLVVPLKSLRFRSLDCDCDTRGGYLWHDLGIYFLFHIHSEDIMSNLVKLIWDQLCNQGVYINNVKLLGSLRDCEWCRAYVTCGQWFSH